MALKREPAMFAFLERVDPPEEEEDVERPERREPRRPTPEPLRVAPEGTGPSRSAKDWRVASEEKERTARRSRERVETFLWRKASVV